MVGLDNVPCSLSNLRIFADKSIPGIMRGIAVKHHHLQFWQQVNNAL